MYQEIADGLELLENRAETYFKNISKMLVSYYCKHSCISLRGAARGRGEKGENFTPSPILGAHFRFEVSCIASFQCQNSMKINNLHALEVPCLVYKGQF